MAEPSKKLIHVAKKTGANHRPVYLYLRQLAGDSYVWYEEQGEVELPTAVTAPTIEEAMRLAHRHWRHDSFRTISCGWRYTLPERDEHGCNALFHQMVASYSTANGVYFDEELGHNCFVNFASQEALTAWQRLRQGTRL